MISFIIETSFIATTSLYKLVSPLTDSFIQSYDKDTALNLQISYKAFV